MGIGNLISNFLFGGLGILDMMGGFGVGILTTGIIVGMRKLGLSAWWACFQSYLFQHYVYRYGSVHYLESAYWPLVLNLIVGQTIPAILGSFW